MVSAAYSAALSGMQAASLQLKISANNIANSNTDGFQTQRVVTQAGTYGVDVKVEKIGTSESQNTADRDVEKSVNQRSNVDVVEELIEMKAAKNLFEANLKALYTENNLLGRILDVMAWFGSSVSSILVPKLSCINKTTRGEPSQLTVLVASGWLHLPVNINGSAGSSIKEWSLHSIAACIYSPGCRPSLPKTYSSRYDNMVGFPIKTAVPKRKSHRRQQREKALKMKTKIVKIQVDGWNYGDSCARTKPYQRNKKNLR